MRLLRPYNPLVYPGGRARPGFDPSHPAAQGISNGHGISAVASGNTFINLLSGRHGNTGGGGANAGINGYIGPSVVNTAGSFVQFTGNSTVLDNAGTLAGIFFPTSLGGGGSPYAFMASSTATSGIELAVLSTGAIRLYAGSGSVTSTMTPITVNTPWFILASMNAGTLFTFAATNLATGQIFVESHSGATTPTAPNGSYDFCGGGSGTDNLTGQQSAGMYGPAFLSVPQAAQWCADPWSFWYLPAMQQVMFGGLVAPSGGATFNPAWAVGANRIYDGVAT